MTTSQTKKITPSPYQAAIFKWVADPNPESKCIIVDAVAGSGKSTTLVEAMNYIPSGQNLMFVAFAKQNVEDLKPKLAANAQAATLNSIGYRAWMRYTGLSKIEINGQLNYTLIENYLSSDGAGIGEKVMSALLNRYREAKGLGRDYDRYRDILSSADMCDEVGPINRLISLAKGSGMVPHCAGGHDKYFSITDNTQDNWRSLIDTHALDIDYPEIAIEIGRRVLEDSIAISKNEIDYDSQLWLPVIHKADFLKYDWIMADECQDQNAIQNEIIFRMMKPNTRAIFVGDPFQCQPEGSIVEKRIRRKPGVNSFKKVSVPIESLREGDLVTSYVMKDGRATKTESVGSLSEVEYHGDLVVVDCGGNRSRYTMGHKCMARWKKRNGYFVYLMRKDSKFRIGVSKNVYQGEAGFGPTVRMKHEKADYLWILDWKENRKDALALESEISAVYGIPQLMFRSALDSGKSPDCVFTQDKLDSIWDKVDNLDSGKEVLRLFGRMHQYPLLNSESGDLRLRSTQEIRACNLMDGFEFKLLQGGNEPGFISREEYCGKVWSLGVTGSQLYFSDNIMTHNSIYAFRGAMSNSMDVIQKRFNAHKFPLSICYRCAKSIVGHAKQLVPHIEHHEGQLDGELVYANIFGPKSFKKTDLVLCRNSRPLVELAYGLFREKVALRILGRDIEHGFIKLAKRCAGKKRGDVSIDVICENLQIWKDREIAKIRAKNSRDPKIGHVEDRAAALSVFIAELPEGKRTLKYLIKSIGDVFNSDPKKQQQPGSILTLSTIHKSKGTEYERVFILDRHLMPSKYALTDEAKQQEANIQYVARTRAKKALIYIDTKDYAANYNGPAMMEVENAVAV